MINKLKNVTYLINVIKYITKDDFKGLRCYVKNKKIKLIDLENEFKIKRINFLIYSIQQNVSLLMVKYIVYQCNYETLNFGRYGYETPLFQAILKKNFKVADFLIEYGADINYRREEYDEKDIFEYLYNHNPTNFKKILSYILNHGFIIHSEDVYQLIYKRKIYNFYALEAILKHYLYNTDYILNFILIYKNKRPIGKKQLKAIIHQNKNRIKINSLWYETAIYKKNYEAIRILYNFSDDNCKYNIMNNYISSCSNQINKTNNNNNNGKGSLEYILGLLESFDSQNKTDRRKEFINEIKNQKIKISIEPYTLNTIFHIKLIREKVKQMILNKDLNQLKSYIEKINISIGYLNNKEFDLLIYAIEYDTSKEIIKYILNHYKILDYYITTKEGLFKASPLSIAIKKGNFEIADMLIKRGADINYSILNISFYDEYENLFDYFYKHKIYHPKLLKYIFSKDLELSSTIVNELIYNNEMKLLKLMFTYYIFNNEFILNLLSIYKTRRSLSNGELSKKIEKEICKIKFSETIYHVSIINKNFTIFTILIQYDNRRENLILNDIYRILNSQGYEYEKNSFINTLQKSTTNFRLKEKLLNGLLNIDKKRIELMKIIKENRIEELINYIEKNDIILSSFNNYQRDILIESIEMNVSIEIINHIVSYYKTLNYGIHSKEYKTPILSALAMNQFEVVDLLLKNGAQINYKIEKNDKATLFYYLCLYNYLNEKNLYYLLHHNVEINFYCINKLMQNNKYNLLKLIFKNYIFDNNFVINLLYLYKRKIKLSKNKFENIIIKEKNKLLIDEKIYEDILLDKYEY